MHTRMHIRMYLRMHVRMQGGVVCSENSEELEASNISSWAEVEASSISSWTEALPEHQIIEHQHTGSPCCAFSESKMSTPRSNLFWLCRIFITSCSIPNLHRLTAVIETTSVAHNLSEQLHPSLHGVVYFDIEINPFK